MVAVLYHPGGMVVVIIESTIVPLIRDDQPVVIAFVVMLSMPVSVAIIVSPISKISMISATLIAARMTIVVSGIIGSVVRAATNSNRNLAVTACQCRCAK